MHLDVVSEESDGNNLDKPQRRLAYQGGSSSSDDGHLEKEGQSQRDTVGRESIDTQAGAFRFKRANSATSSEYSEEQIDLQGSDPEIERRYKGSFSELPTNNTRAKK